jgi:hypothetical protein
VSNLACNLSAPRAQSTGRLSESDQRWFQTEFGRRLPHVRGGRTVHSGGDDLSVWRHFRIYTLHWFMRYLIVTILCPLIRCVALSRVFLWITVHESALLLVIDKWYLVQIFNVGFVGICSFGKRDFLSLVRHALCAFVCCLLTPCFFLHASFFMHQYICGSSFVSSLISLLMMSACIRFCYKCVISKN